MIIILKDSYNEMIIISKDSYQEMIIILKDRETQPINHKEVRLRVIRVIIVGPVKISI